MLADAVESFITRWENSGAAERANYQMFSRRSGDRMFGI
jgi:hypothetical protein